MLASTQPTDVLSKFITGMVPAVDSFPGSLTELVLRFNLNVEVEAVSDTCVGPISLEMFNLVWPIGA